MPDTQPYEMSIETAIMDHFIQKSKGYRPSPSPPHYTPAGGRMFFSMKDWSDKLSMQ